MILTLALALIQAPAAGKSVDELIAAFAKGDKDAEAALLKLGVFAIRPLQKAQHKNPARIDALVFKLKRAEAHPDAASVLAVIEAPENEKCIVTVDIKVEESLQVLRMLSPAAFLDPIKPEMLKSKTFRLDYRVSVKNLTILDDFCSQTGLDYGFFHNHLVVGHPDQLWPSGPPEAPRKLTEPETSRARTLVEKLAAETIEEREAAARELMTLGPSVVSLLREFLKHPDEELATRCSTLILKLEARARGKYGPCAAERQIRNDNENQVLKQLQSIRMDCDFSNQSVADAAAFMGEFSGLKVEVGEEAGKPRINLQLKATRLIDAMCLMTQSHDLDFMIRDRS